MKRDTNMGGFNHPNEKYLTSIFHLLMDQYLMPNLGNSGKNSVAFFSSFAKEISPELGSIGDKILKIIMNFVNLLQLSVFSEKVQSLEQRVDTLSIVDNSNEMRKKMYAEKTIKTLESILTTHLEIGMEKKLTKSLISDLGQNMTINVITILVDGLAETLGQSRTFTTKGTVVDKKLQYVVNSIQKGMTIVLVTGWSNMKGGHLVTLLGEKESDVTYRLTLCNSGEGLQFHPVDAKGKSQIMVQNIVNVEQMIQIAIFSILTEDVFVSNDEIFYSGLSNFGFSIKPQGQQDIIGAGYVYLPKGLNEDTRIDWDFPQLSGSCTFYGIYYLFKYYIYSNVTSSDSDRLFPVDQLFNEINSCLSYYAKYLVYQYVIDTFIYKRMSIPDIVKNNLDIIRSTNILPMTILEEFRLEAITNKQIDDIMAYINDTSKRSIPEASMSFSNNQIQKLKFGILSYSPVEIYPINLENVANLKFIDIFNFLIHSLSTYRSYNYTNSEEYYYNESPYESGSEFYNEPDSDSSDQSNNSNDDDDFDNSSSDGGNKSSGGDYEPEVRVQKTIICSIIIYFYDAINYHVTRNTVDNFLEGTTEITIKMFTDAAFQIILQDHDDVMYDRTNQYLMLILLKIHLHTKFKLLADVVLEASQQLQNRTKNKFLTNFFNYTFNNTLPRRLQQADLELFTDHLILFVYDFRPENAGSKYVINLEDYFKFFIPSSISKILGLIFILGMNSSYLNTQKDNYNGEFFNMFHDHLIVSRLEKDYNSDRIKQLDRLIVRPEIHKINVNYIAKPISDDNLTVLFTLTANPNIDVQAINNIFDSISSISTWEGLPNNLSIIKNQYGDASTQKIMLEYQTSEHFINSILLLPVIINLIIEVANLEDFNLLNEYVILLMCYVLIVQDIDIPIQAFDKILYLSKNSQTRRVRYCFELVASIIIKNPLMTIDTNIYNTNDQPGDDKKINTIVHLILDSVHLKFVTTYPQNNVDSLADFAKQVNMEKKINLITKDIVKISKSTALLNYYNIEDSSGSVKRMVDLKKIDFRANTIDDEPYIDEMLAKYIDDYTIPITLSSDTDRYRKGVFLFPIYGPPSNEYVDITNTFNVYLMSNKAQDDQIVVKLYKRINNEFLGLISKKEATSLLVEQKDDYFDLLLKYYDNCSLVFYSLKTKTIVIDVLKAEYPISIILTIDEPNFKTKANTKTKSKLRYKMDILVDSVMYSVILLPSFIYNQWASNLTGTFVVKNTKSNSEVTLDPIRSLLLTGSSPEENVSLLLIENTFALSKKIEKVFKKSIFIENMQTSSNLLEHYKETRVHIIDINFTGLSLMFPSNASIISYFLCCSIHSKTFALDRILTLVINTIKELKMDNKPNPLLDYATTLAFEGCNSPYFKFYRKMLIQHNPNIQNIFAKGATAKLNMLEYDIVIERNIPYLKHNLQKNININDTYPVHNYVNINPNVNLTDSIDIIKDKADDAIRYFEVTNFAPLVEIYNLIISGLVSSVIQTKSNVNTKILEQFSQINQYQTEFIFNKLGSYHNCESILTNKDTLNIVTDISSELLANIKQKILHHVSRGLLQHIPTEDIWSTFYEPFYHLMSWIRLVKVLRFLVDNGITECREFIDAIGQLRPNNKMVVGDPDLKTFGEIQFELTFGYFLKEPQVRVWKNILDEIRLYKEGRAKVSYSVYQLLMGSGKTSVIIPLLCLSVVSLPKVRYSVIILPKHLVDQTFQNLNSYTSILNSNITKLTSLRRINGLDDEDVTTETDLLDLAFNSNISSTIIMDAESYQVLKLNIIEVPTIGPAKRFSKILADIDFKIKNEAVLIIDEFDSLNNPLSNEVNFSKNTKTLEEYPIISPNVVERTVDYILGLPIDRKSGEIFNEREERCWKSILQRITSLKTKIYNKDYGFPSTTSHEQQLFAVPYRAVNSPINGTEFSDIDIKIILTIASYKKGGLRFDDYYRIIVSSTDIAKQYSDFMSEKQISDILKHMYGEEIVEPITNNLSLLLISDKTSPLVLEVINSMSNISTTNNHNEGLLLIKKYLTNIVLPFTSFSLNQINSSFTEAISSTESLCKSGFSGTVNFEFPVFDKNYFEFNKVVHDNEGRADIYISILGLLDSNPRTLVIDKGSMDDNQILVQTFSLIKQGKYDALIDTGAYLLGYNSNQVIDYARTLLDFEYYVYVDFDGTKKYKTKTKNGNQDLQYAGEQFKAFSVFMYYDHKHTVGIDIKQPYKMLGLVTVSNFNRLTDISQGSYRLRKLNKGHSIDFVIDAKVRINSRAELLQWLINRDDEYWNSECKFKFLLQNVKIIHNRIHGKMEEEKFNRYVQYQKNIPDAQISLGLIENYINEFLGAHTSSQVGTQLTKELYTMMLNKSEGPDSSSSFSTEVSNNVAVAVAVSVQVQTDLQVQFDKSYDNFECGTDRTIGYHKTLILNLGVSNEPNDETGFELECNILGHIFGLTLVAPVDLSDLSSSFKLWAGYSKPALKLFDVIEIIRAYSVYYVTYSNYILLCGHNMAIYISDVIPNTEVYTKNGHLIKNQEVIYNMKPNNLTFIMKYLLGCKLNICEIIQVSSVVTGLGPNYKTVVNSVYCVLQDMTSIKKDANKFYDQIVPKMAEIINSYRKSKTANADEQIVSRMIELISGKLSTIGKETRLIIYDRLSKCLAMAKNK